MTKKILPGDLVKWNPHASGKRGLVLIIARRRFLVVDNDIVEEVTFFDTNCTVKQWTFFSAKHTDEYWWTVVARIPTP